MKQFFKFLLATILGFFVSIFLLFFIMAGIVAGIAGSGGGDEVAVSDQSVLKLSFDYMIPERTSNNPLENFDLINMEGSNPTGLNDILKSIRHAANDEKIQGIYMNVSVSPNSYGTLEEIREALIEFKKSKKFIIAYGEVMEEHSYYLASVADKIYLNPIGDILFDGFSYSQMYLKGMLDKLGVQAQLIRHGKFKAAGEPFITDKMSDENREQIRSFTGSLFNHFITKVAEARKKPVEQVKEIAEKLLVQSAGDAKQYGLVDDLKYEDEVDEELKKLTKSEKDISFVTLDKYRKTAREGKITAKDKIAVIYANGDIMSGEGDEQQVGSDRMAEAIRKARKDSSIKVIVLRVNSPGGSVIASEVIWREVVLAKKSKPVIVSFGAVAASGGYYIAAPADVIVAEPNTITGSIGVFGLLFNAEKLIKDKLGINVEKVKFGEYADLGSPDRPLNAAEIAIIQKMIDRTYTDFIKKVADGRKLTVEQVDAIAEGRVWSGTEAKNIGLVDELGGLQKAIEIAVKKANLTDYRIVNLPEQKDPFDQLLKNFGSDASVFFAKQQLGENYQYLEQYNKLKNYQGIQVRLPFEFVVE